MNEKLKKVSKKFVDLFLPDILDASFSFILSFVGNSIKDRLLRAIVIGILSALGNFFMTGNINNLSFHDVVTYFSQTK